MAVWWCCFYNFDGPCFWGYKNWRIVLSNIWMVQSQFSKNWLPGVSSCSKAARFDGKVEPIRFDQAVVVLKGDAKLGQVQQPKCGFFFDPSFSRNLIWGNFKIIIIINCPEKVCVLFLWTHFCFKKKKTLQAENWSKKDVGPKELSATAGRFALALRHRLWGFLQKLVEGCWAHLFEDPVFVNEVVGLELGDLG